MNQVIWPGYKETVEIVIVAVIAGLLDLTEVKAPVIIFFPDLIDVDLFLQLAIVLYDCFLKLFQSISFAKQSCTACFWIRQVRAVVFSISFLTVRYCVLVPG